MKKNKKKKVREPIVQYCERCGDEMKLGDEKEFGHLTLCKPCYRVVERDPEELDALL